METFSTGDILAGILAALIVLTPLAVASSNHLVAGKQDMIELVGALCAILNVVLLAVQAWIITGQKAIMRRQAEISERQMTFGSEPSLFVRQVNFDALSGDYLLPNATYELGFVGKTPATIRASYRRLFVGQTLPRKPERILGWDYHHTVLDDSNPSFMETISFDGDAGQQAGQTTSDRASSSRLEYFLVAVFAYEDIWDKQYEYAFCFRSGMRGDVRLPYGGAAYNRRRLRKPEERIY